MVIRVSSSSVAPSSLVSSVEALLKEGDRTGAVQLVQGAVVSLKESRVKPDSVLNSALATLVAKQPGLFSGPSVIEVGLYLFGSVLTH